MINMSNKLTLLKIVGGYNHQEELENIEIHEIDDNIEKGLDIVAEALISEKGGKNKHILFITNKYIAKGKKGTQIDYIIELINEDDEITLAVIFKATLFEGNETEWSVWTPIQILNGHEGKYGGCHFITL